MVLMQGQFDMSYLEGLIDLPVIAVLPMTVVLAGMQ
jgi:hypothetical protein